MFECTGTILYTVRYVLVRVLVRRVPRYWYDTVHCTVRTRTSTAGTPVPGTLGQDTVSSLFRGWGLEVWSHTCHGNGVRWRAVQNLNHITPVSIVTKLKIEHRASRNASRFAFSRVHFGPRNSTTTLCRLEAGGIRQIRLTILIVVHP